MVAAKKPAAKKSSTKSSETYQAYCVKCKDKREMVDPTKVKFKNGRNAVQGECKECGTKMTRILPG